MERFKDPKNFMLVDVQQWKNFSKKIVTKRNILGRFVVIPDSRFEVRH